MSHCTQLRIKLCVIEVVVFEVNLQENSDQEVSMIDLLIVSTFMESTTDFLFSSTDIAFSNAMRLTILLHSEYFALASLSLGFTLVTCNQTTDKKSISNNNSSHVEMITHLLSLSSSTVSQILI